MPSSLRFHALSNGYGLSLTLSYEKKKITGRILIAGSKNKRELITSSCSTKAVVRSCKHGRQNDENNIFSSTERSGGSSVIAKPGLMMRADEHTHTTHTHTHTHTTHTHTPHTHHKHTPHTHSKHTHTPHTHTPHTQTPAFQKTFHNFNQHCVSINIFYTFNRVGRVAQSV